MSSPNNVWKEVAPKAPAAAAAAPAPEPERYTSSYDSAVGSYPFGFVPEEDETFSGKMLTKMKNEPLIPIGALATVTAFSLGLRSMLQSNAHRQQMMMRARVGAQAFTILAFLGYSFTNINPQTGMTRMQSEAHERQKKREAAHDAATR